MKINKIVFLTFFITCNVLAQTPQVIYLDKKHQSSEEEISITAKDYLIKPAEAVIINISRLKFKKKGLFKKQKPNFLQLIFDGENSFNRKLDPKQSEFIFDAQTIETISGQFEGFKKGQRIIILLGILDKKNGKFRMNTLWLGAMKVAGSLIVENNSDHDICYQYIYELGAANESENLHHHCLKAGQTGQPSSMVLLAETYYFGHGIKQDYHKAGQWYEKAAVSGHVHAQLMMYFTYAIRLVNQSSEQQKSKALSYLKMAADSGYQKAIDQLKLIQ